MMKTANPPRGPHQHPHHHMNHLNSAQMIDEMSETRGWGRQQQLPAQQQQPHNNMILTNSPPQQPINVIAGGGQGQYQQQQQPQPQQQNDVINMQYIELEEFLLENAVAVVQQQQSGAPTSVSDSKVFVSAPATTSDGSHSPHSTASSGHDSTAASELSPASASAAEKHYQVSLEQRQLLEGAYEASAAAASISNNAHLLATASNNQSPPPPTTSAETVARKSYPRRVSSSSSSSSTNLTASSSSPPQQSSPPLIGQHGMTASQVASPLMAAHLLETVAREVKPRKPVKRSRKESVPDDNKDDKYWKRRAKNNEAAKRSRDLRREKENHILQRVAFLERENQLLNQELTAIKLDNDELRKRLSRYETL